MIEHSRRSRDITAKVMGKTMAGAGRLKAKANKGAIMDTTRNHSGISAMIDKFPYTMLPLL
jgi:hypothetical protein